jgi:hypothetical protein
MVCFVRTDSQVLDQYKEWVNVKGVDAGDRFCGMAGVSDPETK